MNIFCDGGLVGRNPSPIGGTWAYCFVDEQGRRTGFNAGFITPEKAEVKAVTNNLSELIAAVYAIYAAAEGWSGTLYTDSRVTQCRIAKTRKQASLKGIPEWLRIALARIKETAGPYTVSLLGGHPTRRELATGFRKDGSPCSIHNVFCDRLASEQAAKFSSRNRELRQFDVNV